MMLAVMLLQREPYTGASDHDEPDTACCAIEALGLVLAACIVCAGHSTVVAASA